MKIAIKDIKPNPFRHLERYPIDPTKVDALRESIRTTGFWDNVVGRKSNGSVEIAYGHHRIVALEDEFGPDHVVDIPIKGLNDTIMLQMMARENMQEWGNNVSIEHETVRATIQAYADGRISLEPVGKTAKQQYIRYAPSFVQNCHLEGDQIAGTHPYTAVTLAKFLGWTRHRSGRDQVLANWAAQHCCDALELIELGRLSQDDFKNLSRHKADRLVRETRNAMRLTDNPQQVQAVVEKLSAALKDPEVGAKEMAGTAKAMIAPDKAAPDIDVAAERLVHKLGKLFDSATHQEAAQLEEHIKFRRDMDTVWIDELVATLDTITARIGHYRNQLLEK